MICGIEHGTRLLDVELLSVFDYTDSDASMKFWRYKVAVSLEGARILEHRMKTGVVPVGDTSQPSYSFDSSTCVVVYCCNHRLESSI